MNKFYPIVLLCLLAGFTASSQNFYWRGTADQSWSNPNNWSSTSGGEGGAGVPNQASHNAIFDAPATVDVDNDYMLNSITVTNNAAVSLFVISSSTISLLSTDAANPALKIDAGSSLTDSTDQDATFIVEFTDGAKGLIDGTWKFVSRVPLLSEDGPYFIVPSSTGTSTNIQVNGTIILGANSGLPDFADVGDEYVFFNSNSVFEGLVVPNFNWDANSTILVSGVEAIGPTIKELTSIGNFVYNAPNQSDQIEVANLANLQIEGDVEILNTNNQPLVLLGFTVGAEVGSGQTILTTVAGDLTITSTSRVIMSDNNAENLDFELNVQGNVNLGGTSFDLQSHDSVSVYSSNTRLRIGGDLNHTAGTFSVSSTATSETVDLFVVEFNGTAPQNINSVTGTIDNAANQVTLLMNNASGVNLISPLSVGRLSFASASKGVINSTATNVLTVNNTSTGALTINSPDNNGYVDGPLQRRTAATDPYSFPTGGGGVLRPAVITPATADPSTYRAEYFNEAYSDLSVVAPLSGVTNLEYWSISRPEGTANAALTLSLNGAVPGAASGDAIMAAVFNGADWVNARGTTGTVVVPGDATTGTVRTEVLSTFGDFTLGYGAQGALPINLLSLSARKVSSNRAEINWEVTSNSTPAAFEILKSVNGRDFTNLGSVTGIIGKEKYTYTDNELGLGTTYYRLNMKDIDGTSTLSKVVAVLNGGSDLVITSMMPTVVTSRSKLNITSSKRGSLQLVVTDMHGRTIQSQFTSVSQGSQDVWLNLQSLSTGAYQVTGYFDGKKTATIRFVKQ